jgi:hypothetical protein
MNQQSPTKTEIAEIEHQIVQSPSIRLAEVIESPKRNQPSELNELKYVIEVQRS